MALTITPETTVYSSIVDTATTPVNLAHREMPQMWITGEDGNTYEILRNWNASAGYGVLVYRIDKDNVTRTLTNTQTDADLESEIISVTGLSTPGVSRPAIGGVLSPLNYLLMYQSGISSPVNTNFTLWKVNSSGELYCVAGVAFQNGGSITQAMYCIGVCSLTGNRNADSTIYVTWGGASTQHHYRGWRLPSVNSIINNNGTLYSNAVRALNNINLQSTWDEYWPAQYAHDWSGGYTNRHSYHNGWVLPFGSKTRHYFYVGPSDIAGSSSSTFVNSVAGTYGGGAIGYWDLDEIEFSTTTAWAPDLTRYLDNTLLTGNSGLGEMVPYDLYDANGTSADPNGLGDYGCAPNIVTLADGSIITLFGSICQTNHGNQYVGASYDMIARWLAYKYNRITGKHVLIGKGTFNPCTYDEFNESLGVVSFDGQGVTLEYDETRQRLYWGMNLLFPGHAVDKVRRNGFGMVDKLVDLDWIGAPCFLQETDTSYYDFTARYP